MSPSSECSNTMEYYCPPPLHCHHHLSVRTLWNTIVLLLTIVTIIWVFGHYELLLSSSSPLSPSSECSDTMEYYCPPPHHCHHHLSVRTLWTTIVLLLSIVTIIWVFEHYGILLSSSSPLSPSSECSDTMEYYCPPPLHCHHHLSVRTLWNTNVLLLSIVTIIWVFGHYGILLSSSSPLSPSSECSDTMEYYCPPPHHCHHHLSVRTLWNTNVLLLSIVTITWVFGHYGILLSSSSPLSPSSECSDTM